MKNSVIKITKIGDDGYKVISIRIKENTLNLIDDISSQTNRSRNSIINILLENAVQNIEVEDM